MRNYKQTVKIFSKSCKYFLTFAVIMFLMQIYPPYRGKTYFLSTYVSLPNLKKGSVPNNSLPIAY
jgi:hypothetical protein